jgi:hypothetical protein
MKRLLLTPDLRKAAERCIWFEPPEKAIAYPSRLAAYILTYGDTDDVRALRAQINVPELTRYLDDAPPGIFDRKSWAYWNLVVGRYETPAMPVRTFA